MPWHFYFDVVRVLPCIESRCFLFESYLSIGACHLQKANYVTKESIVLVNEEGA